MSAALDVQDITKTFGALRAVDGVRFQVQRGEIVGFIGPNGAGKTTTMRICATLESPDRGDVLLDGVSVLDDPRAARRKLGFMPDAFGAYANTTIWDYLDFFGRAYGLRRAERLRRVDEVMTFTSLRDLREKEIASLSKGLKQRLCLAKTLLHDPAVMILDEPAAGLDPRARVELRELVRALASLGKAILVSSHILTELAEMCDGVVVIERGVVRAHGSVAQIVKDLRPTSSVFVRFVGDAAAAERALLETPGLGRVRAERGGFVFEHALEPQALASVLASLVARGLAPLEFTPQSANLEEVFLSLTRGEMQ